MWINRLDIRSTISQTVQNFVELWPLKAELLLRQSSSSGVHLGWSVIKVCMGGLLGKKMLGTDQGNLEYRHIF